ncbi:hypothetical protein KKB18_10365, partial [bacterium]|nr:hypothetical protein [bacterium]
MSIGKVVSISFLIVTISLYSLVLVRTAWICDDALITYRVVYNFINGYGLRWNTAERVQVYTHPLWMFLNAGVYFLTNEVYYTLIFTGIAVSVISVALYGFFIPSFPVAGILGILILIFSRSFMDFSAAGLENPMTHLLLVLFFIIYFRIVGAQHAVPRASTTRPYTIFKAFCSENHESQHFSNVKPDGKKLFLLGLIAAFAITNRMDTILIYIPAMIYLLSKFRPLKRGIYLIAVSSTPFILWELFSLFYYGFLFPNTAYAKLNTGVSGILLMKHGFRYFVETFKYDPITLTVILISFVVPFLLRKRGYLPLSIGILFYLVYIIKIGGDYMAGRYFTAPIFLSAIILTQSAFKSFNKSFYIMLLSVLFLGFVTPYPTVFTGENFGWDKTTRNMIGSVTDNRRIFYKYSGLLT